MHSFVKGIVGSGRGRGCGALPVHFGRARHRQDRHGHGGHARRQEGGKGGQPGALPAGDDQRPAAAIAPTRVQLDLRGTARPLRGALAGARPAAGALHAGGGRRLGGGGGQARQAGGTGRGADATAAPATLLVVDELDSLVTRRQEVLYNLFEWSLAAPRKGVPRLAVIGIANTMDLPERLLPRILSRAGLRRTPFQPYVREQIEQIVRARLGACEGAFAPEAVDFASRKVAAVSGDVRRAGDVPSRGRVRRGARRRDGHHQGRECRREGDVRGRGREVRDVALPARASAHGGCRERDATSGRARDGGRHRAALACRAVRRTRCRCLRPVRAALHAAVQRMGASRLLLLENGDGRHARAKVGLNVSIADLGLAARADKSCRGSPSSSSDIGFGGRGWGWTATGPARRARARGAATRRCARTPSPARGKPRARPSVTFESPVALPTRPRRIESLAGGRRQPGRGVTRSGPRAAWGQRLPSHCQSAIDVSSDSAQRPSVFFFPWCDQERVCVSTAAPLRSGAPSNRFRGLR